MDIRINGDISMESASVGGSLTLKRVHTCQTLNLKGIVVGDTLSIRSSTFVDVDLSSSMIGLNFQLIESNLQSEFETDAINSLSISSTQTEIDRILGIRHGDLDMTSTVIYHRLDLRYTHISNTIHLWDRNLSEYRTRYIHPSVIMINGLTYSDIDVGESKCLKQESNWFDIATFGHWVYGDYRTKRVDCWIGANRDFSFQPYAQLASVLRTKGRLTEADFVVFIGRQQQRLRSDGGSLSGAWNKLIESLYGYNVASSSIKLRRFVVIVVSTFILLIVGLAIPYLITLSILGTSLFLFSHIALWKNGNDIAHVFRTNSRVVFSDIVRVLLKYRCDIMQCKSKNCQFIPLHDRATSDQVRIGQIDKLKALPRMVRRSWIWKSFRIEMRLSDLIFHVVPEFVSSNWLRGWPANRFPSVGAQLRNSGQVPLLLRLLYFLSKIWSYLLLPFWFILSQASLFD